MTDPLPPSKDELDKWENFGFTIRDLIQAKSSDESDAAIRAFQQAASGLDYKTWLNSLHIPLDAGQHEPALTSMLIRIPDGWGRWIGCDRGWYPLLVQIDAQLRELIPNYEVNQIKEKFGELRFYWSEGEQEIPGQNFDFTTEEGFNQLDTWNKTPEGVAYQAQRTKRYTHAQELVERAEEASRHICEVCSLPGQLRKTRSPAPWLKTVCDEHTLDKHGNVYYLTLDAWDAWWANEKPIFEASRRKNELKSWENKRLLVVGESDQKLAMKYQKVTDPNKALAAAYEDWDGVWLGRGPAVDAFISSYCQRHSALINEIKRRKAQAIIDKTGYVYPKPENAPRIYRMQTGRQFELLSELGMFVGLVSSYHLIK